MTRAFLAVLLLAFVSVGCDSGSGPDDEGNVFAGPYEGQATATFTGGVTVGYDIRLDLDEPNSNGQFEGTIRIVRAPVGTAGEVTATGAVFGLVSGSSFSVSGTTVVSSVARSAGGGIGFGGEGTLSGSTITLTSATVSDFAYAGSAVFSMTLR